MGSKKSFAVFVAALIVFSAAFLANGKSEDQSESESYEKRTEVFNPYIERPEPSLGGIREYTVIAQDMPHEVYPGVFMEGWTLNGTIPGPTFTAIEGETVKIKFVNNGARPTTLHFHGVHELKYDGVHEVVNPGKSYVYELTTEPPGMYIYHSHAGSIDKTDNQGFFGAYLVYPKVPLPPAKEIVMLQQVIDTDGEAEEAEFYAFNGRADYYMNNPIEISVNETIRIYLSNINIEFALFHIHANVFREYDPLGFNREKYILNDNAGNGWGQRKILEFSYSTPGLYMFHDHIGEHLGEGMRGWFKVTE